MFWKKTSKARTDGPCRWGIEALAIGNFMSFRCPLGPADSLIARMKRSVLKGGATGTHARVCLPALPLLAIGLLAGCGGGSTTSSSAVPVSPAASATRGSPATAADAVALVSGTPIAKSSYAHWLAIEKG